MTVQPASKPLFNVLAVFVRLLTGHCESTAQNLRVGLATQAPPQPDTLGPACCDACTFWVRSSLPSHTTGRHRSRNRRHLLHTVTIQLVDLDLVRHQGHGALRWRKNQQLIGLAPELPFPQRRPCVAMLKAFFHVVREVTAL